MVVPSGAPISSSPFSTPPSIWYREPVRLSPVFVISSTWATAAMLARASPRKPREEMVNKSSTVLILLVAWRRNARGISSFGMPHPLSVTRIKEQPPSLISTVTAVAWASTAFSSSSFTTEAGRSMTSPAAILLMVLWSKTVMLAMFKFLSVCTQPKSISKSRPQSQMPGPALSVAFYRYIIPDLYLLYRLAGTFGKERAQAVYADSAHLSLIQKIAAMVPGI